MIKINNEKHLGSISSNLETLSSNIRDYLDSIKNISEFIGKVGDFFKNAIEILSNPLELINSLQPYLILAMMIMIILKLIGFKPEKWFSLCFIILIISLFF